MGCVSSKNKQIPVYKNLIREIFSIIPQENCTKTPDVLKQEFNEQVRNKIINHVKIHIKTLKDHIQDNNLRLIDTILLLEDKVKFEKDPQVQYIAVLILDELIKNMWKFTHNIKIKFNAVEDESKYDLVESIDKSQKEEEKEITLLSDNFIKFEVHYIEIIYFLIDKNIFLEIIQPYAIQSIRNFSKFRKENYTSDKLYDIISKLELFLSSELQKLSQAYELKKFLDLLDCMEATLDKSPIKDQFFQQNAQIIQFVLKLISQANLDKDLQQQKLFSKLLSISYDIIKVFARRAFQMKSYQSIVIPLLVYFDQNFWSESLDIKNLFMSTLEVAVQESVQLNYEVYLMGTILDYLKIEEGNALLNALELKGINLHFVNYKNIQVKIQCLCLLDQLIIQKAKGPHILVYSSDKIIKCLCTNLSYGIENKILVEKIFDSFKIYLRQIAPDTLTFMTILNQITQETIAVIDCAGLNNRSLVHQQQNSGILNCINKFADNNEKNLQNQGNILPNNSSIIFSKVDASKVILLYLELMKVELDQAQFFYHPTVLNDEIIKNIIQIADTKAFTLESYSILNKLTLMKMKWSSNEDLSSQQVHKNIESFLNISITSLNFILYKMWKLLEVLMVNSADLVDSIVLTGKIVEFIENVHRRNEGPQQIYLLAFLNKFCSDYLEIKKQSELKLKLIAVMMFLISKLLKIDILVEDQGQDLQSMKKLADLYISLMKDNDLSQSQDNFYEFQLQDINIQLFKDSVIKKAKQLGFKEHQVNFDEITSNIEQNILQKIPDLDNMEENNSQYESVQSKSISKIIYRDDNKLKEHDHQFENIMTLMKSQKSKKNMFDKLEEFDSNNNPNQFNNNLINKDDDTTCIDKQTNNNIIIDNHFANINQNILVK